MITLNIKKANKANGDYAMFVTFPYNEEILNIIREMPSRYWDNKTKEWEIPLKKFPYIASKLNKYDLRLTGKLDVLEEEIKKPTNLQFNFKTTPYSHQIEGFKFGLEHDKWLLGDEQGLGKTKQVIDIAVAKKLEKGYKHCLIVCGVNGLKWNWANEVKIHSNERAFILGQRETRNGKIKIGSNKDKIHDLKNINNIDAYFIITNVETLRDKEAVEIIAKLCYTNVFSMVAIDEIHKCKNPSSQQGKGILRLVPNCGIAMTGTPVMNNPMDLYIILRWLGYERHSFSQFKAHHCIFGGFGGYEVVGYKNMDELDETIKDVMLRRLKDDVLDLPDKVYIDEYVDMDNKQAQIYREVTADLKANIDQVAVSPNPLAALIRLRQATGYTGILSSTIKESAKLDRLEELVEDIVANGKKCVVFSNWTQMTDEIMKRLVKYNPAIITGETNDTERQNMVTKFQHDTTCKVIVGTIGAMGTGLTLTAGTSVIFMDEPWTMAAKQQAIDRCHRIGTTQKITIHTIMCKDTIDERIHDIVNKKGLMSDALIDGKLTGNKTEILNYLIG